MIEMRLRLDTCYAEVLGASTVRSIESLFIISYPAPKRPPLWGLSSTRVQLCFIRILHVLHPELRCHQSVPRSKLLKSNSKLVQELGVRIV